jgi:hypothetical protein
MWTISIATDEYERRRRRFDKKRWNELEAMDANLAIYFAALNAGSNPQQIPKIHTFVHTEPQGVFAIAQGKKRSGGNLAQTRLYVYPDPDQLVLHLLTMGAKDTQHDDIQFCKECVTELEQRKREAENHEQLTETDEEVPPLSET